MKFTFEDIQSAAIAKDVRQDEHFLRTALELANELVDRKKPLETDLMIMSFYENDVNPIKATRILNRFNRYAGMKPEEVQKEIDRDDYWTSNCDIELIYLARKFGLISESVYQVIASTRHI